MKENQIYKSEGGYRVAFGVWGDSPIVDSSPWFETLDAARIAREKRRLENMKSAEIDKETRTGSIDDLKERIAAIKVKYKHLIADAQPVARDDDPV